jgi:hypothetical protein
MPKLTIPQSSAPTNNIQNQADIVIGDASNLKKSFDQYSIDDKDYTNNTLIPSLNGNDGSKRIGHNSVGITADNVADALIEVNAKDTANVKVTGNQSIAGVKTFTSSPIIPTPTTNMQATTKQYVDQADALKADDNAVVKLTGDQTVNGVKTFATSPLIPTPTSSLQASTKGYVDGLDGQNVKLTGNQTISDVKTFNASPLIPVPTLNAQGANKQYVDATVGGVVLGQIPDGSLTEVKLDQDLIDKINADNPQFTNLNLTELSQIQSVTDSYNGIAETEVGGATLNQVIVDGQNKPNGTVRSFTALNGITYFTLPNKVFVVGAGASVNVTNNTGVNANIMAIPITSTPYSTYTADQMNAIVNTYWEGLRSTQSAELGSKDNLGNITSTAKITYTDPTKFDGALLPNLVRNSTAYKDGKWASVKRVARLSVASGVVINTTNLAGASATSQYYLVQSNGVTSIGLVNGTYTTTATATVYYELATPITITESQFGSYGIQTNGVLTSNNDFTEFLVQDYDLFASTSVTYATNLAKSVENLKESTQGLIAITDGKADKNQQAWIAPTLLNSWVAFGGTFPSARYYKDEFGVVHLSGVLKSGTVPSTAFILPIGYRPLFDLVFASISNSLIARVDIKPNGNVGLNLGSNLSFNLDGISFRAEA